MSLDQRARTAAFHLRQRTAAEVDTGWMFEELRARRLRRRTGWAVAAATVVVTIAAAVLGGVWASQHRELTPARPSHPVGSAESLVFQTDRGPALVGGKWFGLPDPVPSGLLAMAFSPDGSQLAYSDSEGLHVRQLTSGQTRSLGPCLSPCPVAWSADGLQLFTTARGGLRRVVVSTGRSSALPLPAGWDVRGLDVNARGRIVLGGYADDQAALMQVDTTGDRAVVSVRAGGPALIMDPRWSPDGDRVAYIRLTPYVGDRSVYTVDARGGDQRRLPLEAGTPLRLDWSPGGRLAAVVIAHEAAVLVELHQDGTSAVLMTDPGAGEPQDGPVAWRPAG